jgi:hypothetical protein
MIRKSISFPLELHKTIQAMANEAGRSFTKQVVWMLKKYIERINILIIEKEEPNEKNSNLSE